MTQLFTQSRFICVKISLSVLGLHHNLWPQLNLQTEENQSNSNVIKPTTFCVISKNLNLTDDIGT